MADLDFINGLGTSKKTEAISLDNIEAVLFDFAQNYISEAQNNLERSASVAIGTLSSIKQKIKFAGNVYTLSVSLADYYDFINKGVSGIENKFPSPYSFKTIYPSRAMVESIKQWLAHGKLKSSSRTIKKYGTYGKLEKKNLSISNLNSTAYAVATSVKKKGIKPTYFLDKAFTKTYPQLKKDLAKALKKDFEVVVRQINTE